MLYLVGGEFEQLFKASQTFKKFTEGKWRQDHTSIQLMKL